MQCADGILELSPEWEERLKQSSGVLKAFMADTGGELSDFPFTYSCHDAVLALRLMDPATSAHGLTPLELRTALSFGDAYDCPNLVDKALRRLAHLIKEGGDLREIILGRAV